MNIIYRNNSCSDIFQLLNLGLSSYSEFSHFFDTENWSIMESSLNSFESYKDLLLEGKSWGAYHNNKVVGMIYFIPSGKEGRLVNNKNWSIIRSLAVNPLYRKHGIAKKLVQFCIDEATKTNEKYVFLYTADFMKPAQKLYENFGFKKHGETINLGRKYLTYLLEL